MGGDGHSSGTPVAGRLTQPTRAAAREARPAIPEKPRPPAAPTWSCSRWGLPCRRRCRRRGALLPHHFTLAAHAVPREGRARRCVSVALSLGSPPPGVTRHRASVEPGLSSPGPRVNPGRARPSDRLAWDQMGSEHQSVKATDRVTPVGQKPSVAVGGKRPRTAGPPR